MASASASIVRRCKPAMSSTCFFSSSRARAAWDTLSQAANREDRLSTRPVAVSPYAVVNQGRSVWRPECLNDGHSIEMKVTSTNELENLGLALQVSSVGRSRNVAAARGSAFVVSQPQYVRDHPATQMTATWEAKD